MCKQVHHSLDYFMKQLSINYVNGLKFVMFISYCRHSSLACVRRGTTSRHFISSERAFCIKLICSTIELVAEVLAYPIEYHTTSGKNKNCFVTLTSCHFYCGLEIGT